MIRAAILNRVRETIQQIAVAQSTDPSELVFILGPFSDLSKPLLIAVRDGLRSGFRYTAFLEDEFDLDIALAIKCNVMAGLSKFILFVVTDEGVGRGWQVELGDLLGEGRTNASKIGVYYENLTHLPAPARDIITNNPIRQGPLVVHADQERTVKALVTAVNTFFWEAEGG